VYLWTLTLPELAPDYYIGACRQRLLRTLSNEHRDGRFPKWGGTRVVEVHPGGHGLHDHMPLSFCRGLVSNHCTVERKFRQMAHEAGYGRIHRHPEPATVWASIYLAGYLNSKEDGELDQGARRWANVGSYEGVKCKDIIYESETISVFRRAFQDGTKSGLDAWQAYNAGRRAVSDYRLSAAPGIRPSKNRVKCISMGDGSTFITKGDPRFAAIRRELYAA